MKKINVLYWISTILFSAFMLMSGVMSIIGGAQSDAIMVHLGYPIYLGAFLGVAKVLGVIALLVPKYPRLKEWTYAGFVIDILGAGYSFWAVGDPVMTWAPMIAVCLIVVGVSYYTYHRRIGK